MRFPSIQAGMARASLRDGRATQRITETECLETIEYFGRELVEKRGVKLDAFVWDDGWDDFNTLWDFHSGFPNGFRTLKAAAAKYGADQGVWLSPNGRYATAKEKRLAHGRSRGFETNESGFAMAGPATGPPCVILPKPPRPSFARCASCWNCPPGRHPGQWPCTPYTPAPGSCRPPPSVKSRNSN